MDGADARFHCSPLIEPDLWISHIRLSCKHFLEASLAAIHLAPISIRQLSRGSRILSALELLYQRIMMLPSSTVDSHRKPRAEYRGFQHKLDLFPDNFIDHRVHAAIDGDLPNRRADGIPHRIARIENSPWTPR